MVWHRCPLWNPAIGLTACRCIAVDLLHTFYLGSLAEWCKLSFWCLIQAGLWGGHLTTADERDAIAIHALFHELLQFYSRYDRLHPGHPITRISKLTPSKLGKGRGDHKFKANAMETLGAALFLMDYLPTRRDGLGALGEKLIEGGSRLVGFLEDLKELGPTISITDAQKLLDGWKHWMRVAEELRASTPKAHLMYHLIMRSVRQGNPILYQAFADESLNRTLRDALRLCHQRAFEQLGMLKMAEKLKRPSVRMRLR